MGFDVLLLLLRTNCLDLCWFYMWHHVDCRDGPYYQVPFVFKSHFCHQAPRETFWFEMGTTINRLGVFSCTNFTQWVISKLVFLLVLGVSVGVGVYPEPQTPCQVLTPVATLV